MSEPPPEPPSRDPMPVEASREEATRLDAAPTEQAASDEPAPSASPAGRRPWVTYALAAANVAVWILTVALGGSIDPSTQWLLDHGGNLGAVTLEGEQWRLVTSMFLHGGPLHLGMNMLGLITGGRLVERRFGRAGFAAIYFAAGLAGSLASALRPGPGIVSVGASGAIFGVFGALGAYFLRHRDRMDAATTKQARGLLVCIFYNLLFSLTPGIDMLAHLGGLAGGFGCGLALQLGRTGSTPRRAAAIGAIAVAALIAAAFAVPAPVDEQRAAIKELMDVQDKALARWSELDAQSRRKEISDDRFADALDQEILPPWRAMRQAIERSGAGGEERDRLLDYLRLRQEGWEMFAEGLRTGDPQTRQRGLERQLEAAILTETQHK